MNRKLRILKAKWLLFIGGVIVGVIIILGLRFITYEPERVHYHANFAVYIKGVKEQFKGFQYYEETEAACTLEQIESPSERAHMHDSVNDVVHIEDHLVTWGNFFQNLGWGLGNDYLKAADKIYTPDKQNKLTFILNGKPIESMAGQVIQDRDKLLISYGSETSARLQEQFKTIPDTANKYDITPDPAGCSCNKKIEPMDR